ncbi:hypothetical protein SteCoe_9000 [Stentor coeruleus]|uniref:RING-CH-type domain-containing protein n=1 Tax=Stentor coeruleus TaxID=5963 RepID=A0A1R2CIT1_9CILI|nr:hypothetical protein SteCoe_9000 [Stentor coeruleus]
MEKLRLIQNDCEKIQEMSGSCKPQTKVCRICLEDDGKNLISPCSCRGHSKYVHNECLKIWISIRFPKIEGSFCEVCKKYFALDIKRRVTCGKNIENNEEFSNYLKVLFVSASMITFAILALCFMFKKLKGREINEDSKLSIIIFSISMIFSIIVFLRCLQKLFLVTKIDFKIMLGMEVMSLMKTEVENLK